MFTFTQYSKIYAIRAKCDSLWTDYTHISFACLPQWRPQAIVFEIVTDKKFDMIIMLFIGFNMLTMTMDHYQQSEAFGNVLDFLNMIFICIFSSECLMKIFALRYHYFVEPWNFFDLVVVILSILGEFSICGCHS